jgi:hypothetical protein
MVPGSCCLEDEIAIAKLKTYKSPGRDKILAELIQAGGETLVSVIHKLINSIWNKEEILDQRTVSITVPTRMKGDKTDCNNNHGISLIQNFIEYPSFTVKSIDR